MLSSRNALEPINQKALPKLKEKIVVITGANSGIGKETAKIIAKTECKLILGCRNDIEGLASQEEIKSFSGNNQIYFRPLDLSSFKSVATFAEEVLKLTSEGFELYCLLNNAGIFYDKHELTEDGFNISLQVNYLGDFFVRNKYDPIPVYGETKLYVMLSSLHLTNILKGTNVSVHCVDPGNVATNILRYFKEYNTYLTRFLIWLRFKSAAKAAEEVACLILHPQLEEISGKIWKSLKEDTPSPLTTSDEFAQKLWIRTLATLPKIDAE